MRSFRKIERFRVEKNTFKKCCLQKTHAKRQFLHVLKGLKQGLKVQDKEEYLAFTAKYVWDYLRVSLYIFYWLKSKVFFDTHKNL